MTGITICSRETKKLIIGGERGAERGIVIQSLPGFGRKLHDHQWAEALKARAQAFQNEWFKPFHVNFENIQPFKTESDDLVIPFNHAKRPGWNVARVAAFHE